MIVKAPNLINDASKVKIFLSGAIDMGLADFWQTEVGKFLDDKFKDSVVIYDPRRPDWDDTWKQDVSDKNFSEQVNWELTHIDRSDIVLVYFTKDSKAPITFLELGHIATAKPHNVFVYCPEGFYRKGNVDIFCQRYGIFNTPDLNTFYNTIENAVSSTLL